VQGPYLIRSVAQDGRTVTLAGDWSNATDLEVFAPAHINQVIFNGIEVEVERTAYGSLIGKLAGSKHSVESIGAQLPALTNWKAQDGLPERNASYDDSKWTGKIISLHSIC
jgi:hypothetical protein